MKPAMADAAEKKHVVKHFDVNQWNEDINLQLFLNSFFIYL